MNVNDSEIVCRILVDAGLSRVEEVEEADVVLTNTCSVRENAESKVWNRLKYFNSVKLKRSRVLGPMTVGVIGCMAERISSKILTDTCANFVCGPDAYRDLPLLINSSFHSSQKQASVQLSLEETYADIKPVRKASSTEAFVSIMRGCNNMCSFCVVPFTRGRERSRDLTSIISEVRQLSEEGIKEVCLLGQNVNSYHDLSSTSKDMYPSSNYTSTPGFRNIYRSRDGPGARFSDLLNEVSKVDPEMRIRFTSPHPKDFPMEVLDLIQDRSNICSAIHLPVQSGSTSMLERMRRGYTRESYLELVHTVRKKIKGVTISSDFISGFCGETSDEHADTIKLIEEIQFDQAYMYAYSLRAKTHAAHKFDDDVPEAVKQNRLREVIDTFRRVVHLKNDSEIVGTAQLVLVEGPAKRNSADNPILTGRTDGNKRVVFSVSSKTQGEEMFSLIKQGDYVAVKITEATGHTLRGNLLGMSSIQQFYGQKRQSL